MNNATNEQEINLKVKDLDGLLAFLRAEAPEKLIKKSNTYFKSKTDQSFYVRIEEIETSEGRQKVLTVKYDINDDDNGLNRRKELSTAIEDPAFFEAMLTVLGLERAGRKSKVRHAFQIGGLEVAVDEWDDVELGVRAEIEGQNEAEIRSFEARIKSFTENKA